MPSTTPPVLTTSWRRSSRSTGMNNCVETARTGAAGLAVRDSKNVSRAPLSFSAGAWTSFLSALREEVLAD
ncbi:DUF397 domain-containing protein [Streptomyces sp. AK02-01A]|nr:DUF397 domain-containing protein [Streptomyces sp. AK02-01A]MDX3853539.1 DUF397 domain-containing protein [Streptomyces sp. AK02-01A]